MRLTKSSIINELSKINGYVSSEETYSPFYSNIGFEIHNENTGIGPLHLHYSRASRVLFEKFADFTLKFDEKTSSVDKLVFKGKKGSASLAFFDTDRFVFESDGIDKFHLLCEPHEHLKKYWLEKKGKEKYIIHGYSYNHDRRDPDECTPFALGIKAKKGRLLYSDETVTACSDCNGIISLSFAFEALEISEQRIIKALDNAPSVKEASKKCLENTENCVSSLDMEVSEEEAEICAKAIHGLLFNLAKAPGNLSKHISSFPNRGSYPTHFLWDTCFQNLAYEELSPFLAKEFLLQFADTQRCDGKIEQFICSTWGRPEYSQPPLVGWATLRIAEKEYDEKFLKKMLPCLEKNNEWWLNNRMTPYGVIYCPHGLETGQDDSPRFDKGFTLACDMNSYLLSQMRAAAEIAKMLGQNGKAKKWNKTADCFAQKIIDVLYCKEDNIFYDINLKTGKRIKLISCSSLLPLWAGVGLDENLRDKMIKKYLLSKKYFYGDVPFPSVAYSEKCYRPGLWWRGPTWMPTAYLLTELLEKYGYKEQYTESVKKLHDILLKDKKMHELFNSQTGEGLGSAEQGWTCAIFIKLCKILNESK